MHGRRFSSIPHLYPLGASGPIIPAVTTKNVSSHCQMSPGGQNCIRMSDLGVSAPRGGHPLNPQCWDGALHRGGTRILWRKIPEPWTVPVGSRHRIGQLCIVAKWIVEIGVLACEVCNQIHRPLLNANLL